MTVGRRKNDEARLLTVHQRVHVARAPYYTDDRRHNEAGYDCNCANSPSVRNRYCDQSVNRGSNSSHGQVASRHKHHKGRLNAVWLVVGAPRRRRANVGTRSTLWNVTAGIGPFPTLQLTKQITLDQRTPISLPVSVCRPRYNRTSHLSSANDAFCEARNSMMNTGIPVAASWYRSIRRIRFGHDRLSNQFQIAGRLSARVVDLTRK